MHATVAAAASLAARTTQDSVHTGPGYLRWVLLGSIALVVLLAWLLLRGYKR